MRNSGARAATSSAGLAGCPLYGFFDAPKRAESHPRGTFHKPAPVLQDSVHRLNLEQKARVRVVQGVTAATIGISGQLDASRPSPALSEKRTATLENFFDGSLNHGESFRRQPLAELKLAREVGSREMR